MENLQKSNLRVMYLRSSNGAAVGCLAFSVDRATNKATYQLSVVNPLDTFNKGVARHLAVGRLIETPVTVNVASAVNMHDVAKSIMRNMLKNKTAPSRALKAAKHWLSSTKNKKVKIQNPSL
jgi:hypothetical protein